MCGIVGFSNFNNKHLNLTEGLSSIQHRGPDDTGMYFDESDLIGLGHARLSILDLSLTGHQPMISPDGEVVIVFNGEIYNFMELRDWLESKGYNFLGHSDTEVLLTLYLDVGTSLLQKLNGIFSFAIWDKRNKTLFLARDGIGVKPLYYTTRSEGFAFCSELKGLTALLPSLLDSQELDIPALHRYLSFLWCPGEGTPLRNIRKLLPGEAMLVKDGRIERRWYWYRLPAYQSDSGIKDEQAAIEGVRQYLRQAVHGQLVADVPVGAFLSGGLDSSAVVAFAVEQNPEIHCFSIEVKGGQEAGVADDLPYARRVAANLKVKLDVVTVDVSDMATDLQDMIIQLDEPLADPACLNVLYISRLARENGIKVLLSGAGGDDLFSGYRRHQALNFECWWRWLPHIVSKKIAELSGKLDQRNPVFRRIGKFFSNAYLEGDDRLISYFLWVQEPVLMQLYTPEFKAALKDKAAVQPMLDFLSSMDNSVSPMDRMLAMEQRFFLPDLNLNYTDKMSMAAGVEVRVPFLDPDLVNFAARFPAYFKQRGRVGKWVLKKAMEPYLPKEIIYRPKTGFGAPLRKWIQKDLRDLLNDLLSVESLNRRGLFKPQAVHQLIVDNDSGKKDATYILFSLMCIEIWCRAYIDRSIYRPMQTDMEDN